MSSAINTTIGQLCKQGGGSVQTGPFGSQLKAAAYVPIGIPTVMPADIINYRVSDENIAKIGRDDHSRLSRHHLKINDIVYGRRGDIGRHALITKREEGWLCGTGCLRIRFGHAPINAKYISYYLRQPAVIETILASAVGTTMPNLNTGILESVPVRLPPLPEQRAIAHILGSLDDKIELNRQMNATLEAIARALFQSWFIDFDPVHAKANGQPPVGMDAATAALFPDSFEETEIGLVPRGWEIGKFGDIADNVKRGVNPESIDPNTPYIGLEHMPQKSIALSQWGIAGDVSSNKFAFKTGEFLFGKLRSYFHKVGVAPLDGICSTDILTVSAKNSAWYGLVLGHISSTELVDFTTAVSTGTRMPRTNWHDISKYSIVLPSQNIATMFNQHIQPIVEKIRLNIFESQTLAELRDTLLPKLMSGQLRVPEAAEITETIV